MSTGGLPPGLPEDHGYQTLGWELLDWASTYLAQPDGINKGTTWEYTDDQARFVLWFYALHPDTKWDNHAGKFSTGGWLFRRAYRERAKGVGKTPMVGAMSCTELLAPVQFDGWDAYGRPVGRPHPNPLVQLAAVSESQADQTMVLINSMLANGAAEKEYGLDIALSRIYVPNGGKLEKVTASPRSREGARPTFVVLEETHNWVPAERGPEFAEVLRRNLGKLDGRSVEVTNAPLPGENSVAEASHREFKRLAEANDGYIGGVLFDSESIHVKDVKDPEEAIPALKWIYRNSPWVNVNRIFDEICDSNTRESSARKFYFNEIVIGESGWLKEEEIEQCRDPKLKPLRKTDRIALGFKGATRNGAAAVVAVRLRDQAVFLLKMWEKPERADRNWEVPAYEVDQFMRKQFEKRDVFFAYADPHQYQDIVGKWAADYDDVVEEFWLTSKAKYAKAIEGFESAVRDKRVVWNDQANLERHILACHILETPQGDILRKETNDSKRYIAAAQAAVLAMEACKEAIERGGLAPDVDRTMYAW